MIDESIEKITEKIENRERDIAQKKYEKLEKKRLGEEEKVKRLRERDEHTKKLLENASFSEMTTQQKIWVTLKLVIYAGTPFLIYMFMPGIIIALGSTVFFRTLTNLPTSGSITATNFYTFIGIICALLYLARRARKHGSTISQDISISFKELNYKYLGYMFLFGLCSAIFVSAILTLIPDSLMTAYDDATVDFDGYSMGVTLLAIGLLDPIAEEIVFRGYMLNRLLPTISEKKSVWIVTIIFALCHLSPLWILYTIAIGYVLAKISIRHDNIMYSIFIHLGFNFNTVLNYIFYLNPKINELVFGNKILILCYAIIFGTLAYTLVRYYDKLENIGLFAKK